jgi:hypothetical protein
MMDDDKATTTTPIEERVYDWVDQVCATTDTTTTNPCATMASRQQQQLKKKPVDKFQIFEAWLRENGAVFDMVSYYTCSKRVLILALFVHA